MQLRLLATALMCGVLLGCGTTRWSDTRRTATEQLLISDAMDRAVSRLDFRSVAGKTVWLDAAPIKNCTDSEYLVSTLRQHMLADGCVLRDKREEADYVVEVRAGAVGTDRSEVLFGVPATKIPSVVSLPGVPSSVPELPLVKKTEQRAVAKLALFAYNRQSGRPVWQSGVIPMESKAKDLWFLGAGPFQKGTIYDGTSFAGDKLEIPLIDPNADDDDRARVSVAQEAYFSEPDVQLAVDSHSPTSPPESSGKVMPAGHLEVQPLAPPEARPATSNDPFASEPLLLPDVPARPIRDLLDWL